MTEDFRRDKPLAKCPHASCGRGNKTCGNKSFKGKCLKTHFSTLDEWLQSVTSWMSEISYDHIRSPHASEADRESAGMLLDALEDRIETCLAEEKRTGQVYVH